MDSIGDMLRKRQTEEPPEIAIIKGFMQAHYNAAAGVGIQSHQITITVRGAALAGALRPRLFELQELCHTSKRLVIRIQ